VEWEKEKDGWKKWWKKQANEIGMENKEEKKANLRDRWQTWIYGKEKEGKSKEKGKERRQRKRGKEKINNLEKTMCQVTCKPYQYKYSKIMEKENDVLGNLLMTLNSIMNGKINWVIS
jgi:hypothetical protein